MTGLLLAVRALLYMTGFMLLWAWLAVLIRPLDTRLGVSLPQWVQPLGLVLAGLGGALVLLCGILFVAAGRGTPAPFDAPRTFVVVGPYRWVRNPMYLGALGLLGGVGLWLRSPAIELLAACGWLLAHLFVRLYEEPVLSQRFGTTYSRYLQRVNRWLPRRPDRCLSHSA